MASQTCGTTARVVQSSTFASNVAHNNTHFQPEHNAGSVSRHEGCDHPQLRLLIEPLTNTYQVYCTTCFLQGPTRPNQTLAVEAFLADAVDRHFARTESYAHAAALADCTGYWGAQITGFRVLPRYADAELRRMGLLP
jgi:hypothetical protein